MFLFVGNEDAKYDKIIIELRDVRDDSLIFLGKYRTKEFIEKELIIDTGNYYLKIYGDNELKVVQYGIEILDSSQTDFPVYLSKLLPWPKEDTLLKRLAETGAKLLLITDGMEKSEYSRYAITVGLNQAFFLMLDNHVATGLIFGTDFRWSDFKYPSSVNNIPDFDKERYFYWNLNAYAVFRMYLFNKRRNRYRDGVIVDFGIGYNLPLAFRHVITKGKTKTVTKGIHTYNDFGFFARIGNSPIFFTLEYNLGNYIKDPLPEEPSFRLGISVAFEGLL